MIINKKTYHNGQRVDSGSNAFVLILPKINVSGKCTTKLITKKLIELHTIREIALPLICSISYKKQFMMPLNE